MCINDIKNVEIKIRMMITQLTCKIECYIKRENPQIASNNTYTQSLFDI